MTVHKITAPEGDLLNVLYNISPLEWRKYQQRYPEVRVGDDFKNVDRSGYPPFVSFRFATSSQELVEKLKSAIETYHGTVSWALHEHKRDGLPGVNFTIRPSRVFDVRTQASSLGLTPDQYLAEYEPGFGELAYADLVGLTEHVRQVFRM